MTFTRPMGQGALTRGEWMREHGSVVPRRPPRSFARDVSEAIGADREWMRVANWKDVRRSRVSRQRLAVIASVMREAGYSDREIAQGCGLRSVDRAVASADPKQVRTAQRALQRR